MTAGTSVLACLLQLDPMEEARVDTMFRVVITWGRKEEGVRGKEREGEVSYT